MTWGSKSKHCKINQYQPNNRHRSNQIERRKIWIGTDIHKNSQFSSSLIVLTASHACADVFRRDQPLPSLTPLGLMIVQADNPLMQSRSHVVGPC